MLIKHRVKLANIIDRLIEQRDFWNAANVDDPEEKMVDLPDLFVEVVNDLTDILDNE